jgi:hypothetical protein
MSELLTMVLLDSAVFVEWARLQEAELQMATSTSGNSMYCKTSGGTGCLSNDYTTAASL